jgi:WD40 repeat protein
MPITPTKQFELSGHSAGVYALAAGLESTGILSGSGDKMVAGWDLEQRVALTFSIKLENSVYSLLHLPEFKQLLIGQGKGGIHVIDLDKKQEVRHLALHQQGIFDLKYHAGNDTILAVSADGFISIWNRADYSLIRHIAIGDFKLRKADYSPDGKTMALSGADGRLRIFETEMYNELFTFDAHEKSSNIVKFRPQNKWLVSGGWDGFLRFWNPAADYKLVREIPAHNYAIYDIAFSPDLRFCATASRDKTIKIWDLNTFDVLAKLDVKSGGHSHSVNALFWSSFENLLLSGSDDRKIIAWKID